MAKLTKNQAEKFSEIIEEAVSAYQIPLKGILTIEAVNSYKASTYYTIDPLAYTSNQLLKKLIKMGFVEEEVITENWRQAKQDGAYKVAPKKYIRWNLTQKALKWAETNELSLFRGSPHHVGCEKCNGKGYIPEYGHIEGGVCFACNGKGR